MFIEYNSFWMEILGTSLKKEVYEPLLFFQNLKFVEFMYNNVCSYNTYKMFRNYLDPFKRNEHHFNEKNRNNHVKD